jgi:hypothetical protein
MQQVGDDPHFTFKAGAAKELGHRLGAAELPLMPGISSTHQHQLCAHHFSHRAACKSLLQHQPQGALHRGDSCANVVCQQPPPLPTWLDPKLSTPAGREQVLRGTAAMACTPSSAQPHQSTK